MSNKYISSIPFPKILSFLEQYYKKSLSGIYYKTANDEYEVEFSNFDEEITKFITFNDFGLTIKNDNVQVFNGFERHTVTEEYNPNLIQAYREFMLNELNHDPDYKTQLEKVVLDERNELDKAYYAQASNWSKNYNSLFENPKQKNQ